MLPPTLTLIFKCKYSALSRMKGLEYGSTHSAYYITTVQTGQIMLVRTSHNVPGMYALIGACLHNPTDNNWSD